MFDTFRDRPDSYGRQRIDKFYRKKIRSVVTAVFDEVQILHKKRTSSFKNVKSDR
jgi:hypothetical protein